jgi:anthranilate phosphoribosyltransferase
MITVYVLVRIKPGLDRKVLQKVRKMPQVKHAVTVYGEYDLLMKIEVESTDKLDSFIFDTVRTISGVESTTTLITTKIP